MRGILVAMVALAAGACAWVPDGGQYDHDRGVIPPAVRTVLLPGTTMRADVLCLLGEPDWIGASETRFVYQTRIIDSWFFLYLVGGLGVIAWGEVRSELFEFDGNGVLIRHRTVHEPHTGSGDGGPTWVRQTPAELDALFEGAQP